MIMNTTKNSNRKKITESLLHTLISTRLNDRKYYAKEVSIDAGSIHVKRVDVMQFIPNGVFEISDIEKGIFAFYEIKSCVKDVYSGNGLNFLGERNYIVTTTETYKELLPDIQSGHLRKYIKENYPESSPDFGILIAVPGNIDCRKNKDVHEEFLNPTPFPEGASSWKFCEPIKCIPARRKRSMVEFLFCMLRAKHNYTNQEGE